MKFFFGLLIGLLAAVGIAVAAAYYAFDDIKNISFGHDRDRSADITRTYDFADFDSIDLGGVFELDVTVGGAYAVELSGAPEDMERVEAEVSGGALKLDLRDRKHRRWGKDQSISARIAMPALAAIDVSGVVDGHVRGVDSETFGVSISGVGDMDLSGVCGALTAEVSGVGDLDAKDLKCRTAEITVSGVGDADIYASESAKATVSGVGDIDIYGSPAKVEKSAGMFSDISVH
ncbi:MAG: head GIN domain-containing protein [Pseudomonadota bacterium]|nr:head GIN domain-containing protein [Pseudomonadota bacterium]